MKKILLLAGVACLFANDAAAMVIRPYVSVKGRVAYTDNNVKVVQRDEFIHYNHDINVNKVIMGASGAFGLMFPFDYRAVRVEVEYNHNNKASKEVEAKKDAPAIDASVQAKAVFGNIYYDFQSTSAWVPYVGGGLGAAKLKTVAMEESDDKSTLAWNACVGLQYRMSRNGSLDFGYRYVYYGSFKRHFSDTYEYRENDEVKAAAHELYAGLRITW